MNRERELLDLNVKFKEEIEEYKAKLEVLTEKRKRTREKMSCFH